MFLTFPSFDEPFSTSSGDDVMVIGSFMFANCKEYEKMVTAVFCLATCHSLHSADRNTLRDTWGCTFKCQTIVALSARRDDPPTDK